MRLNEAHMRLKEARMTRSEAGVKKRLTWAHSTYSLFANIPENQFIAGIRHYKA
jgi:hypothetical protein